MKLIRFENINHRFGNDSIYYAIWLSGEPYVFTHHEIKWAHERGKRNLSDVPGNPIPTGLWDRILLNIYRWVEGKICERMKTPWN